MSLLMKTTEQVKVIGLFFLGWRLELCGRESCAAFNTNLRHSLERVRIASAQITEESLAKVVKGNHGLVKLLAQICNRQHHQN